MRTPPTPLPSGLRAALTLLPALCAAVVIAASRQTWRRVGSVSLTGTEASGALVDGLGLVGLAATALLLVMGPVGRRLVGLVLVAVGLGTVLAVLDSTVSAATWAAHGVAIGSRPEPPLHAAGRVALVAGAVMALGGAALAVAARRWPVSPSRFARNRRTPPVGPDADPRDVWAAMDRGEDPTRDQPPELPDPRSEAAPQSRPPSESHS
ncbi:Trp biosynthesis-associated membrane protein [Acidipropionibacterium jensenii]|uniref:Tryptophan-associated transmembrane protein (Trp_oprn_chp) n=2 Tax=Acidipropionibacterium jensenii TaxID=1749 RepID=A0A448NW29_9ACTN|nr:Trp biosynthesis-associated membrane protein [Acidipropionibacterium jensenii]MDN5995785.1 Trp biosynthesis-associated membrane protein [Acidipropionibacterium jensenii]MDN6426033.1 Trp biosynthesis-associated membrane protein [Acidipropionibacterium jensenii]MDN6442322.1 Trp biosynthesis-associated membrane protein [Acidipropionibacterium jensenii]MDN6479338.1 Trp biosynthesis-associated membrane protein [Acidipropionibacterium jensenii]MDN6593145.1 Trp biosynthesis-associated membrane pro